MLQNHVIVNECPNDLNVVWFRECWQNIYMGLFVSCLYAVQSYHDWINIYNCCGKALAKASGFNIYLNHLWGSSNLFNMIQSRGVILKANDSSKWSKEFLKQEIKFRILVDSERFDEFCENLSSFEFIQMLGQNLCQN